MFSSCIPVSFMFCPHGGIVGAVRPLLLASIGASLTALFFGLTQISDDGPNAEACPDYVRPFSFDYGGDVTSCGWGSAPTAYRSAVAAAAAALFGVIHLSLSKQWESWVQRARLALPLVIAGLGGALVSDGGNWNSGKGYCETAPEVGVGACSGMNAFLGLVFLDLSTGLSRRLTAEHSTPPQARVPRPWLHRSGARRTRGAAPPRGA